MCLTRRNLSLETQGVWVPSFDWVSYVDVYVFLVCVHSWTMF